MTKARTLGNFVSTGNPLSDGSITASDISGLGTGVATALAINVGSAGAPVVNGGALGTPSSGTLTSATGLPIATGVSGLGTGVATALAVNVGSAGAAVVNGGALGTPSSGTLTSATGLPLSTGVTGTLPIVNGGTNSTATPTAGTVPYGTGTALAYTSAGTSGQLLQSNGASAPTWVAAPATSAAGSTGQLQYNNAGAFAAVSSGTSGQLLTSAGAGVVPTWTTPATPASGLTLITTLTASNSTTLTFTNTSITSTYDLYLFVFNSIKFVNHNRGLGMRVSTDNGATFISAAGSYSYAYQIMRATSGSSTFNSNSATYIPVFDPVNVGNTFAPPESSFNGVMYMANPLSSGLATQFWGNASANDADSYNFNSYVGGGFRKNEEANNAIQFYEQTDGLQIASGTIQIFGVQK